MLTPVAASLRVVRAREPGRSSTSVETNSPSVNLHRAPRTSRVAASCWSRIQRNHPCPPPRRRRHGCRFRDQPGFSQRGHCTRFVLESDAELIHHSQLLQYLPRGRAGGHVGAASGHTSRWPDTHGIAEAGAVARHTAWQRRADTTVALVHPRRACSAIPGRWLARRGFACIRL
jgi:hypothetical protein